MILILAGGTGGHIIPALAVCRQLILEGKSVHWLGSEGGLEQQLVTQEGIPLHCISVQGVRGKGVVGIALAPFRMLRATYQALKIIRREKPTLVIGFGGFVSAPGGLAAWLLKIPLVIHEQNAIAGMTNRCLAHLAPRVFQAFPNTFPPRYHAITVGNPVRTEIVQLPPPEQRYAQRLGTLQVLILGGSQGACAINQAVLEMLRSMPASQRPKIWHMTGKKSVEQTKAAYEAQQMDAEVVDFIDDMASAYAWADLVICRAGALTISELTAAGVASILIPYPHAVDDHQTKNATHLIQAGAAVLLPQTELNAHTLSALFNQLSDRSKLLSKAIAARQIAQPNATQQMVAACRD